MTYLLVRKGRPRVNVERMRRHLRRGCTEVRRTILRDDLIDLDTDALFYDMARLLDPPKDATLEAEHHTDPSSGDVEFVLRVQRDRHGKFVRPS